MYFSDMLYQAERIKTAQEQREADVLAGELAESIAGLWRSLLPATHHPAPKSEKQCEACLG